MKAMNEEKQIIWIAGQTAANMLGWGSQLNIRAFTKWNIRCRKVLKNAWHRIECCLEDVELRLKSGGMKRIETRSRNQEKVNLAPIGEMPPDPIRIREAVEILDVSKSRVQKLVKNGRLRLFKMPHRLDHFYSEREVRDLKRSIDAWKTEHIMRQDDLAEERDSDLILAESYRKARRRGKRIEIDDLRKFERGLGLMITTREAAYYLEVTTTVVNSLIDRGALKATFERPYWGGEERLLLLVSDVKALLRDKSRIANRRRWEEAYRPRDWRAETRQKLQGEKPAPFIHKIKPKPASASEKQVVPAGPPEWTYSQSRDWTAYICEIEARVRRTMKPQW